MVDCDGDAETLLSRMADDCPRLAEIFAACENFDASVDFKQWLRAHRVRPSASYVNWVGRSVAQVREEARLHDLLRDALPRTIQRQPQALLAELRRAVGGAVRLTPAPATPLAWCIRNVSHLLTPLVAAAAFLFFFPLLTIAATIVVVPAFLVALRWHEQHDPIIRNPYDPGWVTLLRQGEDHDVSNQYTAMGSIKPACSAWRYNA
jgi:hypothetical protein